MASHDELPAEVIAHYGLGSERSRLLSGAGRVERARTEEVLARWLPPPPARILDVAEARRVARDGGIVAVAAISRFASLLDRWTDDARRERVLAAARAIEREPSLLGLSAHLLAVARR